MGRWHYKKYLMVYNQSKFVFIFFLKVKKWTSFSINQYLFYRWFNSSWCSNSICGFQNILMVLGHKEENPFKHFPNSPSYSPLWHSLQPVSYATLDGPCPQEPALVQVNSVTFQMRKVWIDKTLVCMQSNIVRWHSPLSRERKHIRKLEKNSS